MKKLSILLLMSLFFAVTSCKEDDDFSNAEIVAQEVHKVMDDNSIHRVIGIHTGQSYVLPASHNDVGRDFEFYSHFVRIDEVAFNLDKLLTYEVREGDGVYYLLLSF